MFRYIESHHNPIIKATIALKQKKHRLLKQCFLLEGERLCQEALNSNIAVLSVFIEESLLNEFRPLLAGLTDVNVYIVNNKIMEKICSTESPQGIAIVAETPSYNPEEFLEPNRFYLLLDSISDPGNMGTIVRTAWALGADGILLYGDCVEPYSPKVVRSSMGGVFNIPIIAVDAHYIDELKKTDFQIYCSDSNATKSYEGFDFSGSIVIAFGSEAHGLSLEIKQICSDSFFIPMIASADSLNVAIASGIIMSKVWSQRR